MLRAFEQVNGSESPCRLFVALIIVVQIVVNIHMVESCLASPHPFREQQPNGTLTPNLWLHGGPQFHYMMDEFGYTAMRDEKDQIVYAMRDPSTLCMVPSGMMVGDDDPAKLGIERGIYPDAKQQSELCGRMCEYYDDDGNPTRRLAPFMSLSQRTSAVQKNLVLLVRFSNHQGRRLPSAKDVDILFNKRGGHQVLAPTGSVRDVFQQSSYGRFNLETTVYGWVNLRKTEQYYSDRNSGLSDVFVEALHDALDIIDSDPNFSFRDVDSDADGTIDALTILHSGYGAEWGGTDIDGHTISERIWSHKWSLPSSRHWYSREGVRVNKYNVNPSLWGLRGSSIGHIGVISHELGHILSLPDLYDGVPFNGVSGSGIGSYGLMSNSWGFDGSQFFPPTMSPWSKMQVGWLMPTVISKDGTYTIEASVLKPDVYQINIGNKSHSSEYLLIENRQPIGFDAKLPQGGLAIWHIDENAGHRISGFPGQEGWPQNGNHYRVALLQADGSYHLERGENRGDANDLYHGDGVTHLGPSRDTVDGPYPNSDAYQGGTVTPTGVRIHSISRAGTAMTFSVELGERTPPPTRSPTPKPTKDPTPYPTPSPTGEPLIPRELVTPFRGGNGASGNMFNVKPLRNMFLLGVEIHADSTNTVLVEVWTKHGTHVGFEADRNAWTLVQQAVVTGQGTGNRTPLSRFNKPVRMNIMELRAFYIATRVGGGVRYTNGIQVGAIYASNGDLVVYEGVGKSSFFGGTYPNRRWNGVLHYAFVDEDETPAPTPRPTQKPSPSPTPLPTPLPSPPPTNRPTLSQISNKIETTFVGGSEQAGIMFDLVAFRDITITGMEIHTSIAEELVVEIFTKVGSHRGFETECAAWRRVAAVTILGNGTGKPTPLPPKAMTPVPVMRYRVQSLYVTIKTLTGKGMRYTRGSGQGKVVAYDTNLAVLEGVGKSYPCGNTFLDRIFNGVLHYHPGLYEVPMLPSPPPTPVPNARNHELATTFIGGITSYGCMFNVIAKQTISVVGMRLHVDAMGEIGFELWTKRGSYVGSETNRNAWVKTASGTILGKGRGQQSPLKSNFGAIVVHQGHSQAFYVTLTVRKMRYTEGVHFTKAGSNSDLIITKGVGRSYPFGTTYQDRVWNGVLLYTLGHE